MTSIDILEEIITSYHRVPTMLTEIKNEDSFLAYWLLGMQLPQIIMEYGLDIGDANLVGGALECSPALRLRDSERIYLVEVDGFDVDINKLHFHKGESYFEWQKWRLKGMINKSYTGNDFSKWEDEEFSFLEPNLVMIKSNKRKSLRQEIEVGEGIHKREGKIFSAIEQDSSHNYRFNYKAILKPLSLTHE